ncbi:MFS transporter [Candidatus Entotheonella palauensis]|uniref:MFS transporter n=1 Tax=Candidatus Entotheonella palauensis TaxID=93172 RepID=UPI000B7DB9B8|nr:MFS transporter [Candidatus Entotheonella palauensis]
MMIPACLAQWPRQTFRALRTRNYRLFFVGQVISRSGWWMQMIAENWLVIDLGGSGLILGMTSALQFAPLLLFSAYAGVLVDRRDTRILLIVTQCGSGLLALIVGLLALTGMVQIWMIWLAAFLLGCLNAFEIPAREAFTMELAGPTDVTNAVALNHVVRNSARAFGPALGGGLIAWLGISACFLLNAASYAIVVAALCRLNLAELYRERTVPHRRGQIREGWDYVWRHPTLRTALLITAVTSTFCTNFIVLLPLYISHTFQSEAAIYGFLMSCLGIGMVMGALAAASWTAPTLRRAAGLALCFGLAHAAVGLAPNLAVGFFTVGVMGGVSSMFFTCGASYFQLHAGESMRGRVMALYTLAYLGTILVGGPLVGWLAQSLGVRTSFWIAALPCMVASGLVFFSRHRVVEPVSPRGENTT